MPTTFIMEDELVKKTRVLTGIQEQTANNRESPRTPSPRDAAQRLGALGGSEPALKDVPRRRLDP